MKTERYILLIIIILKLNLGISQMVIPKIYFEFIKKGDSLYVEKEYLQSALTYSEAFKSNKGMGLGKDLYKSACSWALANYPDSSFRKLDKLSNGTFLEYNQVVSNADLIPLYNDIRWQLLLNKIKVAGTSVENYGQIRNQLDSIYNSDQKYRKNIQDFIQNNESNPKKIDSVLQEMSFQDQINFKKVEKILDTYGWIGSQEIGEKANSALFLVIQHADLPVQEKYLPILKNAVKNNKALPADLALLEDRIAIGSGKKQIYGSQVGKDSITKKFYLLPLDDPENVDSRRLSVGLPILSEYLQGFGIKWDLKEYVATHKNK
jgi:hypothetical protein